MDLKILYRLIAAVKGKNKLLGVVDTDLITKG